MGKGTYGSKVGRPPKTKKKKKKGTKKQFLKMAKLRRVPKDKKTGVPKKYLSGSKNRSAKAAEIKRTAELYEKGLYIDIKAVQKSRVAQDASKSKTKKKTAKRKSKKSTKSKSRRN